MSRQLCVLFYALTSDSLLKRKARREYRVRKQVWRIPLSIVWFCNFSPLYILKRSNEERRKIEDTIETSRTIAPDLATRFQESLKRHGREWMIQVSSLSLRKTSHSFPTIFVMRRKTIDSERANRQKTEGAGNAKKREVRNSNTSTLLHLNCHLSSYLSLSLFDHLENLFRWFEHLFKNIPHDSWIVHCSV